MALNYWFFWWPGTGSNRRHADFQSAALPTELPGLYCVQQKGKLISLNKREIDVKSRTGKCRTASGVQTKADISALTKSLTGL